MKWKVQPGSTRKAIKVLFLGQCIQFGYEGVSGLFAFPNLARGALEAQFPEISFRFNLRTLYHPKGLRTLLRRELLFFRPDITVISLPTAFAATSWRVNLITQLAPELTYTARSFLQKIDATLTRGRKLQSFVAHNLTWRPSVVHPPLELAEYEALIESSIGYCRDTGRSRLILMGPGRFNEDTTAVLEKQSPELWSSVNQMILRVGDRLNIPTINAQDALDEHGYEVFLRHDHRFSHYGQEIVAREMAAVLASQIPILKQPSGNGKE